MERLVIAAVLVVVAVAVALVLQRRRPAAPTQGGWDVPHQLDRDDFAGRDRPWLVTVFTSDTCESCAKVVPKAAVLESDDVAFDVVSYQARRELHDRYRIGVVPLTLVSDADGVVHRSFIGAPSAIDLWGALAEVREPGSIPAHELHNEA